MQGVGTKFVVHNYGHGGAGITMSWGCAVQVRDSSASTQAPPSARSRCWVRE